MAFRRQARQGNGAPCRFQQESGEIEMHRQRKHQHDRAQQVGRIEPQPVEIADPAVVEADPDVLFIACCGYDLERTLQDMPLLSNKIEWNNLKSVRQNKVYLTDGNAYFSRPGPRLVDGLEIMANALHPNVHQLPEHLIGVTKYQEFING